MFLGKLKLREDENLLPKLKSGTTTHISSFNNPLPPPALHYESLRLVQVFSMGLSEANLSYKCETVSTAIYYSYIWNTFIQGGIYFERGKKLNHFIQILIGWLKSFTWRESTLHYEVCEWMIFSHFESPQQQTHSCSKHGAERATCLLISCDSHILPNPRQVCGP